MPTDIKKIIAPMKESRPLSTREALAKACLDAALTRVTRKLVSAKAKVIVFMVPGIDFAEPLAAVLAELNPEAVIHPLTEKKKPSSYLAPADYASYLGEGRSVHAISQSVGFVPDLIREVPDITISVRTPSAKMVRAVIGRVTGGRATGLDDKDLAGRTLDTIAAATRPGSSAAECVIRLKRQLLVPGALFHTDAPPDLARLPVFGPAREWADEMLSEIERIRSGQIGSGELEATILHGPPGTGKTLLARALARTARLPLIETSVASWFTTSDGHLDGVLKAAERFFNQVLESAPAVGLLDELEAIPDRATLESRHREWWNSVVTGVLLMISRLRESGRPVILVGATNYLDRVDGALKRPGRLGRHVLVRPPDSVDEVAALLSYYLGEELGASNLQLAAGMVLDATPAAVEALAKGARRRARAAERALAPDDLIAEIVPPDDRSPAERLGYALHEAAHAVVAHALGCELVGVSILSKGASGGMTRFRARSAAPSLQEIEDRVVVYLAGRAADEALGAGADLGAKVDLEESTRTLVGTRVAYGLRETLVFRGDEPDAIHLLRLDPRLMRDVEADLQRLMGRARELVDRHRRQIRQIADALLIRPVLQASEIMSLLEATETADADVSSDPLRADGPERTDGPVSLTFVTLEVPK